MEPMPYSRPCATGQHRTCTTTDPAACACGCHTEENAA